MSNEVAAFEAEVKEYKNQVRLTLSLTSMVKTDEAILTSSNQFNQVSKLTLTMRSCKISR